MATINSGITMRIIPQTLYDFSNLQGSQSMNFPLGQHIEAGQFTEVDVLVRLHAATVMSEGQTLQVALFTDGYDFSDPASVFFSSGPIAEFSQAGVPTLPAYNIFSASATDTPFGRYIAIQIGATQASSATTLIAAVSVDITLKGGDPSAMPMSPNSYRGYRIL
jgi:hypothetical protein